MADCKIVYQLTVPTTKDPHYHKTRVVPRAMAVKIAAQWGTSLRWFQRHESAACQTGTVWIERSSRSGRGRQRLTFENASDTGVWRGGMRGLRR